MNIDTLRKDFEAKYGKRILTPESILEYSQFLENKIKNLGEQSASEGEPLNRCCAQSSSTTKNKDGLLPCPFCGNEARIIYKGMWKGEKQYDIGCTIGGIGGACIAEDGFDWNFFESDKQRFIGYWNKRA